ncbi:MAG: transglycosylase SLT domain-containing protein [Acidobacteriia bacterium]|nr:transglycosylase SLT domain-containing protein [Terriglobia bacterium]
MGAALILSLGLCHQSLADGIYTYVDANGKQVYTNILPAAHSVSHGTMSGRHEKHLATPPKAPPSAGPSSVRTALSGRIAALVKQYDLKRFNLGPEFVEAVITVESDFNPTAVSPKGALGLMQLMPETARRFGVRNVFNAEQNLEGGIQYLNFLLDLFHGDVNLTLAAYNAGENVVQKLRSIPPYRETREYVKRVGKILGDSKPVPLYDVSRRTVTYVALVAGRLQFSNIDPPDSAIVFDGYHMPRTGSTP